MTLCGRTIATLAVLLASTGWLAAPARGQATPPSATKAADSEAGARRQILKSDRWRQTRRRLDQWLTSQRIYTAAETAKIRAELDRRVPTLSSRELEDLLFDMEDRLDVLTSPEADDARLWVSQFLSTARNAEEQLRNKRPDVMNMSANEIRQELQRFQRQRSSRQQTQSAFDRGRAQQVQTAQGARAANQQSQAQLQDSRARAAANAQNQIQNPTRPQDLPNYSEFSPAGSGGPIYGISPWGTPIRWNPFHATNR